jgi:hypothetical protein
LYEAEREEHATKVEDRDSFFQATERPLHIAGLSQPVSRPSEHGLSTTTGYTITATNTMIHHIRRRACQKKSRPGPVETPAVPTQTRRGFTAHAMIRRIVVFRLDLYRHNDGIFRSNSWYNMIDQVNNAITLDFIIQLEGESRLLKSGRKRRAVRGFRPTTPSRNRWKYCTHRLWTSNGRQCIMMFICTKLHVVALDALSGCKTVECVTVLVQQYLETAMRQDHPLRLNLSTKGHNQCVATPHLGRNSALLGESTRPT